MIRIMETKNDKLTLVNGISPARQVPPGSILGEELKSRGIRQKDFACSIGIQPSHLSALIHGSRSFTADISSKIEQGLEDIPASFWMKLQAQYNQEKNRQERHYSAYVDGYKKTSVPTAFLMDSGIPGQGMAQVSVSLPTTDLDWFEQLARRLGWTISE